MALREAVIGVHHKGCWGSLSTIPFPDISMTELGPVQVEQHPEFLRLTAVWNVTYLSQQNFLEYVESLDKFDQLEKVRIVRMESNQAVLKTVWTSQDSSYQAAFKDTCVYTSPVTQEKGFEVYTVVTENPQQLQKVLENLEQVGQVKIFRVGKLESGKNNFDLTPKQLEALATALEHNYYTWPRKMNLNELATAAGVKRRTLQENLRRAEGKVFAKLKGQLLC